MVVVLSTFENVPIDVFERSPLAPEPPKILTRFLSVGWCRSLVTSIEKRFDKFCRIFKRHLVHFNFVPRDKESTELRGYLRVGSSSVFGLEEVAHTISGAFVDNHGVWFEENTRTSRANNVFGRLAFRFFPKADFGAVNKRIVGTTNGVGFFSRTDRNLTIALRNTLDGSCHVDAFDFFLIWKERFSKVVQERSGIVGQKSVEHILNVGCNFCNLRYDERVEALAMNELKPCHVDLDNRGTAPLTSFEHNDSYGLGGKAKFFEQGYETTLRTTKNEMNVALAFTLDNNIECTPKAEVVEDAYTNELLYDF